MQGPFARFLITLSLALSRWASLAATPLPLASTAAEGFAPDLPQRLRHAMQAHIDAGKLPGVMMLVARHGHIVAEEALGYRNLERQTPTTPDTIYRLFSATKPFTAVTALSLVDEGKLELDAPVARYLPEFSRLRCSFGAPATIW